jgi:ribosomal protein S27E
LSLGLIKSDEKIKMLNTQIIYPSAMMKITCPNCRSTGNVRAKIPPRSDFIVLCPHCKDKFLVKVNVRQYYRKKCTIPVSCFLPALRIPDVKDLGEGIITDISMGGMCVRMHERPFLTDDFREGKALTFIFSLPPRNERLKVSGEIVRVSKEEDKDSFNVGVKFYSLDKFAEKQIGFFLLP